jgi:hypothetical protein
MVPLLPPPPPLPLADADGVVDPPVWQADKMISASASTALERLR